MNRLNCKLPLHLQEVFISPWGQISHEVIYSQACSGDLGRERFVNCLDRKYQTAFTMYPTARPLVLLSAWVEIALASNIFVSHYQGTVQSLNLDSNGGSYTLTQNSSVTLGGQPSWLTFDSSSRILYAADETGSGSASVWSVAAATNGKLTQSGKASAALGSVHNALYGSGYLAQAH